MLSVGPGFQVDERLERNGKWDSSIIISAVQRLKLLKESTWIDVEAILLQFSGLCVHFMESYSVANLPAIQSGWRSNLIGQRTDLIPTINQLLSIASIIFLLWRKIRGLACME